MAFRVYGIRHHGPGSARRLRTAFDEWQPDCILIEGPADGQTALGALLKEGMEPPLAMVLFAEGDIENASFLPFARFSPEYQAIDWAERAKVPYQLIDLPATHYLVRNTAAEEQLLLFNTPQQSPSVDEKMAARLRRDPLALLAELAGYTDSERWWDATVERGGDDSEGIFTALLEAITQLRTSYPTAADAETLKREAYMREQLRKAIKAGHERIAVVVGAWHGPVLADTLERKAATDKALLKGLPKVKIKAAWIPWSYPRLSRQSGYGAGVVSPAWYQLLFEHPNRATEHWMVAAAQLLRSEGFDASPALAADGVQLAKSLASLRGQLYAGAEELDQAVLSTLAGGKPERLELIRNRLITGNKVGKVPPGISTVPLLEDLQKELKATRMAKLWEITGEHYLKATKTNERGGIDLRTENDLRKSHLLHRLDLLGISWGKLQPINVNSISSFKEIWLLEWYPEFNLLITERSGHGNTLPLAAGKYTLEKARNLRGVDQLAELVLASLRADLPRIVPGLVRQLRDLATHTQDTAALLAALPTLVNTCRYGDSRKTDTSALLLLIEELVPRLAGTLAMATTNIDAEQAQQFVERIAQANYALGRLAGPELLHVWHHGLKQLLHRPGVAPAVNGLALRLLFDQQLVDEQATQQHFHYSLSAQQGPLPSAEWISGFLHGSSQLILHFPPLWKLLSEWVGELAWEEFESVLPLLRRSLADFSQPERRKIFQLVEQKSIPAPAPELTVPAVGAPPQNEDLLAALRGWLGN